MLEEDEDTGDLLRALAWTPRVMPFTGTPRYHVKACIGEGGFGVVYAVQDRERGRDVALKMLKQQRQGDGANIRRLKREFRSAADLVHPNLIGLHELASHDGRWFFTMDLVRGVDFVSYVGGDQARLRSALLQLAAGVRALHDAGIVHRDLKPSNVLVGPDGHLVILDFGLSGPGLEPDLFAAGTPAFIAPEQARGDQVSGAADWYAVGAMVREALVGCAAGDLERLAAALMRPEPAQRAGASEIVYVLGGTLSASEVVAVAPRFVGRERELGVLQAAYEALCRGEARQLRIHGQPGVGKSSLLERFTTELPPDALVLVGRCHEREAVPYKAFDGVVEMLAAHLHSLPIEETLGLLPDDIALAVALFPVLEGVDVISRLPRPPLPADPRELRTAAFVVLADLLSRVAASRRLVLVLDDLQWGDIDSARLLLHLLAPPRPPLLTLLAYRSDDVTQSAALGELLRMLDAAGERGDVLAINPLAPADAESLASQLLGSRGAEARLIADRGEGHPLFIAELARASRDQRSAAAGLLEMLWHRVEQLPTSARALLETIAVAGEPLAWSVCGAAAGVEDTSVRLLRAQRFVRAANNGELNVFHDRIRDAIIARLDPDTRRCHHLALARQLADRDLEATARHYDAANEADAAASYAIRAAGVAMRVLAFDRAVELYELAIRRGSTDATTYERLGDARLAGGSVAAAGHAYLQAAERSERRAAIDLMRRGAEHLVCAGDFDAGYRALEAVTAEIGERLPSGVRSAIIESLYHMSRMRLSKFRLHERPKGDDELLHLDVLGSVAFGLCYLNIPLGLGIMMRFARQALASGDPQRVARGLAYAAFGMIGNHSERHPLIDELLTACETIANRHEYPDALGLALRIRAESHYMFGEYRATQRAADEASRVLKERCRGMNTHHRFMDMVWGRATMFLGDLEAARERAESLLRDTVEREDPVSERGVRVGVLSHVELAYDRSDRAREHLRRAVLEDRCGVMMFRAEAAATIAMYDGCPSQAVAEWDARWPKIRRDGMLAVPGFRMVAVRSFGTALIATGGRANLARARRLARMIRGWQLPVAVAIQHSLEAALADRAEVRAAAFARAADAFTAAEMPLDAAACRYRRAVTVGESGDVALDELRTRGIVAPRRWVNAWFPDLRSHAPGRVSTSA